LPALPAESVDVVITSPPYFRQKDYGIANQFGWEDDVNHYVAKLETVFLELLRITKNTGACFVIIGDTYIAKSMQLVPQRAAIAAVKCGWTLRNDLIWAKTDAAPGGGGADRWRFTHEHILFFSKKPRGYKFNAKSIRVPYSNQTIKRWGNGQTYGGPKAKANLSAKGQRFARGRSFDLNPAGTLPPDVLTHATARSGFDHYATFPIELIERFVLAATDPGDVVLDPFSGTSTTGVAAVRNGRRFVGIELSPSYCRIGSERLAQEMQDAAITSPPGTPIS
jgi:site-specific DNA-methyltransferase (adenine-specific)